MDNEFKELGKAVQELKEAVLNELKPVLKPIADFLNKILGG